MSHIAPKRLYVGIFGTLMVLTAITVGAAFINLGSLNFPVAIGIAVTKAVVVLLFFMHVKYGSRLTKLVVGCVLFFMASLLGLTLSDYGSRGWFVSPRGTAFAGTQVTVGPAAPAASHSEAGTAEKPTEAAEPPAEKVLEKPKEGAFLAPVQPELGLEPASHGVADALATIAALVVTPVEAAQPEASTTEPAEHGASPAGGAVEKFDAGKVIIEHVSNSSREHPLIHLPLVAGIDFSVTKHVLMLWLVAATLFFVVTLAVRKYVRQDRLVPSGFMTALEMIVEFVRDSIVLPNVGAKWVGSYAPLLLTLFFFILGANLIGLIPVFDALALLNHTVLHASEESLFAKALHGGVTSTGNFNVTAALATVTFFTIIAAGTRAHGFVKHWKNLVPHGSSPAVALILIPIEVMGMFVRPFALTMRLAANMTGGHVAVLATLSFVFIFGQISPSLGVGVGMVLGLPLAVGISALEIIVVAVQAYVFTLLTAVFIGMAIHAHH